MSILSERYASTAMKDIWSPESKILAERNLWITVMKAQAKLGFEIPAQVIADYNKVKTQIDLASIDKRERELRHDVKARIEEFNALAGHQYIHIAMTSRDLTENIELLQIRDSLILICSRTRIILETISEKCEQYASLSIVARTHNVPAQLTTLGRRFAYWGEELLFAHANLLDLIKRLPLKGLKGAVGTSIDLIELFGDKWNNIEQQVFSDHNQDILIAPTQTYPRSIDFEVVSCLVQIGAALSNIAVNIRLMAGLGLVTEGKAESEVGSSAMPHKNNPRLSERINSLYALLKGYLAASVDLIGNQWNEGDVSCSAARRIILPEAFFVAEAQHINLYKVLNDLKVSQGTISEEVKRESMNLASSQLLMSAVKKGVGREIAHNEIQRILKEEVPNGVDQSRYLQKLRASSILRLNDLELLSITDGTAKNIGAAEEQTLRMVEKINNVLSDSPTSKYDMPTIDN